MRGEDREALHVIYTIFRERGGEWPTFDDFNRHVIRYWRAGADAARIVREIPEKLLNPLHSTSYEPDPEEHLILTIAGVKYCEGRHCDDVTNFLAAVRWMAQKWEMYDPPPGESRRAMPLTVDQLRAGLALPVGRDRYCIDRLIALLKAEGLVLDDGYSR
jgi:hypothetical protein